MHYCVKACNIVIMNKKLQRILPRVQKPARYVGGEYNAVMKDLSLVDTSRLYLEKL